LQDGQGIPIDLEGAAHYFKLSADQGNANGQWRYGECLRDGKGIPIDLEGAAHYFKLSADQGNAAGQWLYGVCLQDGQGIPIDLEGAAHYFKLSADQGNADGSSDCGMAMLTGLGQDRDCENAIRCFQLSARNGGANGRAVACWMAENDIVTGVDLAAIVGAGESASDQPPAVLAVCGRCCQTGRGVPVDFTVAAEFFQRAALSGDADSENSFGGCLERGDSGEKVIETAVRYYCRAASQSHPGGLYNFGRCLEHGKGIPRDFVRAAKYYRLAAKLNHPMAENSFGVCLERGIGVPSNPVLATRYYNRSAVHGDPDGANNFGFCLEHGRGVKLDIEAAAECYKFAWDRGHPEGEVNYRRCLRILGRWEPPDRSSRIADHRAADDRLAQLVIDCADDRNVNPELAASIRRFKAALSPGPGATAEWIGGPFSGGYFSSVSLAAAPDGSLTAVKTGTAERAIESIGREATILETLKHPLVVRYRGHFPGSRNRRPEISTEFVGNGSLASHLAGSENCNLSPTRIARIISGIALAMRFLHSRGITHRDLAPQHILLDWDWNVRIAHFGCSGPDLSDAEAACCSASPYRAPECYENGVAPESDVFSFGLILFELAAGRRAFPDEWKTPKIARMLVMENWRPEIPDSVRPATARLISECWDVNLRARPSFSKILRRLAGMRFGVVEGVNSRKIEELVKEIEEKEVAQE
jgi:TPR repeat protein